MPYAYISTQEHGLLDPFSPELAADSISGSCGKSWGKFTGEYTESGIFCITGLKSFT